MTQVLINFIQLEELSEFETAGQEFKSNFNLAAKASHSAYTTCLFASLPIHVLEASNMAGSLLMACQTP